MWTHLLHPPPQVRTNSEIENNLSSQGGAPSASFWGGLKWIPLGCHLIWCIRHLQICETKLKVIRASMLLDALTQVIYSFLIRNGQEVALRSVSREAQALKWPNDHPLWAFQRKVIVMWCTSHQWSFITRLPSDTHGVFVNMSARCPFLSIPFHTLESHYASI